MSEPATRPVRLLSKPGIKRDGTRFDGDEYVDGQWVRFQRGLPRKIGGYRRLTRYATGIPRQIYTQAADNFVYTHIGHENGVQRFTIDTDGNASTLIERTPAGYAAVSGYGWNFDAMRDAAGASTVLLANPARLTTDISDITATPVYYGDVYATTALAPLLDSSTGMGITTAGNVLVLHPYLFLLSANGHVRWSDANDPGNLTTGDAGDAYIDSAKLVKGLPLRGGGQAPAGLIWSLNSLIRVTYTGGDAVFQFDTVTASTSILAVNGVIEYDGIYYWIGLDRFLAYNGVVREVPNDININFFFDNLNFAHANKVFAMKVPRFGEIWWCFPKGDSTECNHAVVLNAREGTWYDTALPNGGRSAAIYAQVYRSPIMAGIEAFAPGPGVSLLTEAGAELFTEDSETIDTDTGSVSYKMWRHETGVDEIDGQTINAIESYFETSDLSGLTGDLAAFTRGQPTDRGVMVHLIEPDFVQTGDMTLQVVGRANASAPEVYGDVKTFPPGPTAVVADQQIYLNDQRREIRFIFKSNTVGGNYEAGAIYAHIGPGDGRYGG